MEIRLIVDPPQSGAWNMSWDEALLATTAASGAATLRLYRWNTPTLSLGYFQSAKDRARHTASQTCPWVRRSTGGGAIMHDQELTYSFAWPAPPRGRIDQSYRLFHQTLVEALAFCGTVARQCESAQPQAPEPFLCFQRRAAGDLLVGEHKVGGSAQRRRRGAALQHGSVLWRRSPRAPELPGIADLTDVDWTMDAFQTRWLEVLRKHLPAFQQVLAPPPGLRLFCGQWTRQEEDLAERLHEDRFTADSWNDKR